MRMYQTRWSWIMAGKINKKSENERKILTKDRKMVVNHQSSKLRTSDRTRVSE